MGSLPRILLVDDSPTARCALRAAVELGREVRVVGEASDGREALRLAEALSPDLITMDVHLKASDGIEVTEELMRRFPTPILVVTALNPKDPHLAYRAVAAGALDLCAKPPPPTSPAYAEACRKLSRLVKTLARVPVVRRRGRAQPADLHISDTSTRSDLKGDANVRHCNAGNGLASTASFCADTTPDASTNTLAERPGWVLIGASTGGPPLIASLLIGLARPIAGPVVIVQHMTPGFGEGFAEWLRYETKQDVVIVNESIQPLSDRVYLAPDDRHLVVSPAGDLVCSDAAPEGYQRPSIDRLFSSAAVSSANIGLAVLLTGMGSDGARGLLQLYRQGVNTIAQRPDTCVVGGMPGSAIEQGAAERIMTPQELAAELRSRLLATTPGLPQHANFS